MTGPLLAALAAAGAIAAATAGAAPAGEATPAVEPAPPPGGYCRVRPVETWPAFTPGLPTPDLTAFQDYREGLGVEPATRGAGVTVADVEYEWRAGHAELAPLGLPAAAPAPLDPAHRAAEHGTAVLGVLAGVDDGAGVTGLAPEASLTVLSPFTEAGYQPQKAISAAAGSLGPGDVLLIELQAGLSSGAAPYVPIEVYPQVRAAIRAAVDRGIVVVEPAGNSGGDIAELLAAASTPAPWLADPGHEAASGALVVAGGGAGLDESGTPDLRRVAGSNHGARVDLQGYGGGVVTSGYGDQPWSPPGDAGYTACFDGTSSAAATVAGAVAALQGAAIAERGVPLTPAQVRDLLVATGTPQADPVADGTIGPRPDVAAAVAALPPAPPEPAPPASQGGDAPPPPPAGSGVVPAAPPPEPAVLPMPSAPAVAGSSAVASRPVARPALRRLRARLDRRSGRLRLRLAGLAPRATVKVGQARARVVRGRVLVRRPRRVFLVRVNARATATRRYRPSVFRVVIRRTGAPHVVRVR